MIRSRAGQTKQMVLIAGSVVASALLGFLASAGITVMAELHSHLLDIGTLAGAAFGGLFALGLIGVKGGSKKYPHLGSPPTASA